MQIHSQHNFPIELSFRIPELFQTTWPNRKINKSNIHENIYSSHIYINHKFYSFHFDMIIEINILIEYFPIQSCPATGHTCFVCMRKRFRWILNWNFRWTNRFEWNWIESIDELDNGQQFESHQNRWIDNWHTIYVFILKYLHTLKLK